MLDFTQQVISGVALGCVYGLIALGFVLIYKATEVVNFAQGEIMMLGAFMSVTFITTLGLNYWLSFLLCVIAMAILGAIMERLVLRPILGYPQFSIVMATIGLGLVIRALVGIIWGTDDLRIETPFTDGVFTIGIVESLSGFYLPEGFKDVAAYIVLLAVLLWKPQGLFGLNAVKKV
jgi:branched-chain amino acid transport system permease protein